MALRALVSSVLPSLVAVAFALVACGGRTESDLPGGGDDPAKTAASNTASDAATPTAAPSSSATSGTPSTGPTGSSSASNPGSPFPVCPDGAPQVDQACDTPSQGCAYVDYQAGTCVSFTCDANGKWQSSTPAGC